MGITSAIVLLAVIWFMVFFVVLPLRVLGWLALAWLVLALVVVVAAVAIGAYNGLIRRRSINSWTSRNVPFRVNVRPQTSVAATPPAPRELPPVVEAFGDADEDLAALGLQCAAGALQRVAPQSLGHVFQRQAVPDGDSPGRLTRLNHVCGRRRGRGRLVVDREGWRRGEGVRRDGFSLFDQESVVERHVVGQLRGRGAGATARFGWNFV